MAVSLDEAVSIERKDGRCGIDITPVTSDAGLYAEACSFMYEMFEREVFDIVIADRVSGSVFASVVADRVHRGLAIASASSAGRLRCEYEGRHGKVTLSLPEGIVRPGMKVAIVCDVLRSGKDIKALIGMIEGAGAKVIKIGCFVEDSDHGARKGTLKGYPLESRIVTEDY